MSISRAVLCAYCGVSFDRKKGESEVLLSYLPEQGKDAFEEGGVGPSLVLLPRRHGGCPILIISPGAVQGITAANAKGSSGHD